MWALSAPVYVHTRVPAECTCVRHSVGEHAHVCGCEGVRVRAWEHARRDAGQGRAAAACPQPRLRLHEGHGGLALFSQSNGKALPLGAAPPVLLGARGHSAVVALIQLCAVAGPGCAGTGWGVSAAL